MLSVAVAEWGKQPFVSPCRASARWQNGQSGGRSAEIVLAAGVINGMRDDM